MSVFALSSSSLFIQKRGRERRVVEESDVSWYPDMMILLSMILPWCAVNSEHERDGGSSNVMLMNITSLLIIKIPSFSSVSVIS